MAGNTTSRRGGAVNPRPRLIATLLVLLLLLIAGLAWQATAAVRMHAKTSEGVVLDYARLALDEYARRAMAATGYYGYYTTVTELRGLSREAKGFPFEIPAPETGSQSAAARQLVRWIWQYGLEENSSHAPGATSVADYRVLQAMDSQVEKLATEPLPEAGFVVGRTIVNDREVTYVASRDEYNNNLFGFVVDESELGERLEQVFAQAPLLPESLAGGLDGNDYLQLRHIDSAGNTLFVSGSGFDNPPVAARQMQDEYNGIFAGHTLSVAIDPAVAGSLVIGGLPRSRLPVLLVIIGITAVLLAVTFRQLRREYALMKLRSDFVAEVSHELRTPLAQIRMFAETLLFDRVRSEDERRRALTIINRESQRLIHLVENVLMFSRADDGRSAGLERSDQSLGALARSAVEEFRPLADAAGMRIETSIDSEVHALTNGDALRQVLINLLDNAVKYGPDGQTIGISVSKEPEHALLSISDQGPGIPIADRKRVLQPYRRLARERKAAIAGAGIGLAVVNELVHGLGGRVSIDAASDGGTRVDVRLPLRGSRAA